MILITGAAGTVGTALSQELKDAPQAIRLAFRSPEKARQAQANGFDVVLLDYDRPETLGPALKGVESLFLLSNGVVGQAEGEINVVEAARHAGVRRMVKLSVWGADAEAYALARMHRSVEQVIERSGLEWIFLRPNNFMQTFITYDAASIRAEGAFYAPAGEARVNHIDVRDIARVAAQVLTMPGHAGKAYNLSGPQALGYAEVAAILSQTLGKPVQYVDVADDVAHAAMLESGMPERFADDLIELYQYFRAGNAAEVSPVVRELTGRQPIAFEQFAREHAAAFV